MYAFSKLQRVIYIIYRYRSWQFRNINVFSRLFGLEGSTAALVFIYLPCNACQSNRLAVLLLRRMNSHGREYRIQQRHQDTVLFFRLCVFRFLGFLFRHSLRRRRIRHVACRLFLYCLFRLRNNFRICFRLVLHFGGRLFALALSLCLHLFRHCLRRYFFCRISLHRFLRFRHCNAGIRLFLSPYFIRGLIRRLPIALRLCLFRFRLCLFRLCLWLCFLLRLRLCGVGIRFVLSSRVSCIRKLHRNPKLIRQTDFRFCRPCF